MTMTMTMSLTMASSKSAMAKMMTSAMSSAKRQSQPPPMPPKKAATAAAAATTLLRRIPSLITTAVAPLALMPLPAVAAEIEKAKLFDFNLTLPIMMVQFLLLMVALDKVYFTPLGNFMDKRDADIKEKLNSVKDTSAEVKELEDQAAAIMRAARAEIAAALTKMKKEAQAEVELKLAEGRRKVDGELQEALALLEKQKDDTIMALDSQIAALSQDIVKKVLPL